jgi:hypothetical protein
LPESSSVVPSKASVAINRDIVKPIPPSQAHPCNAVQLTPSGSEASRNRTAASAAPVIPSGFPMAVPGSRQRSRFPRPIRSSRLPRSRTQRAASRRRLKAREARVPAEAVGR